MKLHPLTLAIAEAPIDPFNPDGPARYKVVARSRECPTAVFALTAEYDTAEAAIRELADTSTRLNTLSRMAGDASVRVRALEQSRWRRK